MATNLKFGLSGTLPSQTSPVPLQFGYEGTIPIGVQTYSVTTYDITFFLPAPPVEVVTQTYTVDSIAVDLTYNRVVAANTQTYTVDTIAVDVVAHFVVPVTTQTYTVTPSLKLCSCRSMLRPIQLPQ